MAWKSRELGSGPKLGIKYAKLIYDVFCNSLRYELSNAVLPIRKNVKSTGRTSADACFYVEEAQIV